MKTFASIVFAGTLLAPAVFGSDAGAEERFRLKHGQYTPQEEARRDCCPRKQASRAQAARDDMGAEARFRTKWGRSSAFAAEPAVAAPASTREAATAARSNAWAEQWLHAKLGIQLAPAQTLAASSVTRPAPANCPHPVDCPEHCC